MGTSSPPTFHRRTGFTLVELLVVASILALLMSILMPALFSARQSMKKLKCSSNMRSSVVRFLLFADGLSETGQGDSERLGPNRFRINDFQESLYGIDEFWDSGSSASSVLGSDNVMMCPGGRGSLTKRRGFPCGKASLQPMSNVTLSINMRLYRAVMQVDGESVFAPLALTHVSRNVLDHPYVPVMFDVDGLAAAERVVEPFYSAPPLDDEQGAYGNGRNWMPSDRHSGNTNVAFVGGHVLSSTNPASERWNWKYQAAVGRE